MICDHQFLRRGSTLGFGHGEEWRPLNVKRSKHAEFDRRASVHTSLERRRGQRAGGRGFKVGVMIFMVR